MAVFLQALVSDFQSPSLPGLTYSGHHYHRHCDSFHHQTV
jgi:hypothetical protein